MDQREESQSPADQSEYFPLPRGMPFPKLISRVHTGNPSPTHHQWPAFCRSRNLCTDAEQGKERPCLPEEAAEHPCTKPNTQPQAGNQGPSLMVPTGPVIRGGVCQFYPQQHSSWRKSCGAQNVCVSSLFQQG